MKKAFILSAACCGWIIHIRGRTASISERTLLPACGYSKNGEHSTKHVT